LRVAQRRDRDVVLEANCHITPRHRHRESQRHATRARAVWHGARQRPWGWDRGECSAGRAAQTLSEQRAQQECALGGTCGWTHCRCACS
jgi:hypothetical protein